MGAAFVFATANISQPKTYWQNYLGEMDDGQMQSFIDYSDDMIFWEDELDLEPSSSEFIQRVAERISEAIEVAYSDSRDIGFWEEGGNKYAITGGPSWGADPTEAMQELLLFDYLQTWAEDQAKV